MLGTTENQIIYKNKQQLLYKYMCICTPVFDKKRELGKKKTVTEKRIIFQFPVKRNTLKNKIMKEDIMGYLVHIGYSQVRMNNTLLTDVYCLCEIVQHITQKKSYAR